jgi:hypothetical protein
MLRTRSLRVLIPIALLALSALGWSRTQTFEATPPTAEQEYLAKMVGTWDAKVAVAMGVGGTTTSTGTEINALVAGGKWLTTDFQFDFMGTPFEGHGVLGWDATKKKFVGTWVDSFSESFTHMEGELKDGALAWDYETTMMGMTNKIHDDMTWDGDDKRLVVSSFRLEHGLQEHMRIELRRRTGGSR